MDVRRESTEVSSKPKRRSYSAEYKRRILDEVARATVPGEVGAICRREGIYGAHLSRWRAEAESGSLEPKQRGPKPAVPDERDRRIVELERELAAQRRRADRAELLVEIQTKVSELMGVELATPPRDEEET